MCELRHLSFSVLSRGYIHPPPPVPPLHPPNLAHSIRSQWCHSASWCAQCYANHMVSHWQAFRNARSWLFLLQTSLLLKKGDDVSHPLRVRFMCMPHMNEFSKKYKRDHLAMTLHLLLATAHQAAVRADPCAIMCFDPVKTHVMSSLRRMLGWVLGLKKPMCSVKYSDSV
jgi:hypothetical protein